MTTRRIFLKSSAMAMVGIGAAPAWLSRALYAQDAPSPRKKILVAIFQRGAMDGLNAVVPFGEQRYYDLRPNLALPKPNGTPDSAIDLDGFLRSASVARAAEAAVGQRTARVRSRGGLARSDAVAFRRAGLHGIGDARPQGDFGRLAESRAGAAENHFAGARS
jgi:uncharacterized protein (DUF1501 family)